MHCGVLTCDTNSSAPRGGRHERDPHRSASLTDMRCVSDKKRVRGVCSGNYSCKNNGGIGGEVTGEVMPSGKKLIPALSALGVKVELWLGEDDSRQSALHMFKNPTKFAADLIAVAKANPGLSGFNLEYPPQPISNANLIFQGQL